MRKENASHGITHIESHPAEAQHRGAHVRFGPLVQVVRSEKLQHGHGDAQRNHDPCAPEGPGHGRAGEADEDQLKRLLQDHHRWTGSKRARELLDNWSESRAKFVKVFPNEYKRALTERKAKLVLVATESTPAVAAT